MYKGRNGFTLVEVMIAVAIVAVLSTLALIAYSGVQKKGRDAKRQSDLGIIQSALEQYHSDQNYYPQSSASNTLSSPVSSPDNSKTYLSSVPKDPLSVKDYFYESLPVGCNNGTILCTSYSLCANLENAVTSPATCQDATPSNYNYAVSSP